MSFTVPGDITWKDTKASSMPVRRSIKVNARESRFGPYSTRPRWDHSDSIPHSSTYTKAQSRVQDVIMRREQTEAHEATIRRSEECEYLHLLDFRGAEMLIEAIEAAGKEDPDSPNLFRYVKHLSLGKEFIWSLMENTLTSREMIRSLTEKLEPRNICLQLDIYPKVESLRRLEKIGSYTGVNDPDEEEKHDSNEIWKYHYRTTSRDTIESLITGWSSASITIHNVTAQYLPVSYSNLTRIFYASRPPGKETEVDEKYWTVIERAEDISNLVGLVNNNEKYEFIGVEDLPNLNIKKGFDDSEETDPRIGDWSMGERVRQQMGNEMAREALENNVRFVEREKSEACVCCGGR